MPRDCWFGRTDFEITLGQESLGVERYQEMKCIWRLLSMRLAAEVDSHSWATSK